MTDLVAVDAGESGWVAAGSEAAVSDELRVGLLVPRQAVTATTGTRNMAVARLRKVIRYPHCSNRSGSYHVMGAEAALPKGLEMGRSTSQGWYRAEAKGPARRVGRRSPERSGGGSSELLGARDAPSRLSAPSGTALWRGGIPARECVLH